MAQAAKVHRLTVASDWILAVALVVAHATASAYATSASLHVAVLVLVRVATEVGLAAADLGGVGPGTRSLSRASAEPSRLTALLDVAPVLTPCGYSLGHEVGVGHVLVPACLLVVVTVLLRFGTLFQVARRAVLAPAAVRALRS